MPVTSLFSSAATTHQQKGHTCSLPLFLDKGDIRLPQFGQLRATLYILAYVRITL
jgi:hypothetical protein